MVAINSLEDLKRVLFVQKRVAQQLHKEMTSLVTDKELAEGSLSGPDEARRVIMGQARLLDKYAKYPTLSEFSRHPVLAGATKWGATFGVAVLIRALVLDQVKLIFPQLGGVTRPMYIVILRELNDPQHEFLIDPLEEAFRFYMKGPDGKPLADERTVARKLLYRMAETFLGISTQYGIIVAHQMGFAITDLGRRCLLHLADAERFVTELVAAHKRFQSRRAKLSCV